MLQAWFLQTKMGNRAMPLKPSLVDLRQYPLHERTTQLLVSLEELASGETLLVVNDRDSALILDQLKSFLEKGFSCWVTEEGPDVWRIFISRTNN